MQSSIDLDLYAFNAAKIYMGSFAWPTVLLGLVVTTAYIATPVLVVTGALPLIPATLLMAVLTYAAYTVLHDAAHGSISGSHTNLRWLNESMGYIAAWILMIPLTAHRHEHLAHHRHTNDGEEDPDFVLADMVRSPFHAARAVLNILLGQFRFYLNTRWSKAARAQNLCLCLEVIAAIVPRVAFCAAGFWIEGVALFAVAAVIGILALMFLFAYIVHTPHASVGRYVDTSTIVIPGPLGRALTLIWGFQNYHSIHHLFPRIPFYHYNKLFQEIEPVMAARGAPIYTLGTSGLVKSPTVRCAGLEKVAAI